jgi:NADPH:quinone reductase-like Zn-dependent oxidoreductase
MKCYRIEKYGDLDGIVLRDAEMPQPQRNEVLVRVRASSLNYRDLAIVRGFYGGRQPRVGIIPVSDGAGEIVALGEGVRGFAVGDRVLGLFRQYWLGGKMPLRAWDTDLGGSLDGMLTEYRALSAEGVLRFPTHLSDEEAATLPCAALTAWHALHAGEPVSPGETVLLQGSGGVSVFALQFAKLLGARTIALSSSEEKMARLRELGADATVNYKTHPNWDEEVLRFTGGRGAERVIEVGGPGTLERSMRACAFSGDVVIIGVLSGNSTIDPAPILGRRLTLRAISTGNRDMVEQMCRAIGAAQMRPVIDRRFDFGEVRAAYEYLESARHIGKVVIQHPQG